MRVKSTIFLIALVFALFIMAAIDRDSGRDQKELFSFSEQDALDKWKEKIFKGKVDYTIDIKDSEGFVHGISQQAASGYYYRLRYNPREKPWISWKWKVIKFPDKKRTDIKDPDLDDYGARVYVVFPSGSFLNSKCIEYVWDEFAEEETVESSPYSKNLKIYVVRSGRDEMGQWVYEERNLVDDYKKAFGYNLKLNVGAVAFMTDADSVKDTSEAFFDEIRIGYKKEK